jgi:hypothetical protein
MAVPSQISNQEDPVNEGVSTTSTFRSRRQPRDVREEQYSQGPPPRTLADFLPLSGLEERNDLTPLGATRTPEAVKCPFCDEFEGDEVAVSHHVEQHLT